MHLTLFIPELLWPEPADPEADAGQTAPALHTLLGAAACGRLARQSCESRLAALIGQHASLAACRLAGELGARPDAKRWWCADPAQLRFHHERVVLGDAAQHGLAPAALEKLLADLNDTFADLGRFHAPHPERWYLEAADDSPLPQKADLPPPSAAWGRELGRLLPEAPRLARLMNEVQMFLHSHPLTAANEEAGRPVINGLWFWGAAAPSATPGEAPPDMVWSDDILARGLAVMGGVAWAPLPENFAAWQAAVARLATKPARALVVLPQLLAPSLIEDAAAWRAELARLEADWFAPLLARQSAQPSGLTWRIESSTAFGVLHCSALPGGRLRSWMRRMRFWPKKPASLTAIARRLAETPP
jgi:hypothetical protein